MLLFFRDDLARRAIYDLDNGGFPPLSSPHPGGAGTGMMKPGPDVIILVERYLSRVFSTFADAIVDRAAPGIPLKSVEAWALRRVSRRFRRSFAG